jgi:hypothetical protein
VEAFRSLVLAVSIPISKDPLAVHRSQNLSKSSQCRPGPAGRFRELAYLPPIPKTPTTGSARSGLLSLREPATKGGWHFLGAPDVSYSNEIYLKFRTNWLDDFYQTDRETHLILRRVVELMQRVDPKKYNQLFYRLFDFLDELSEQLPVSGADALFDETRFTIKVMHRDDTGEIVHILRQFGLGEDILNVDKSRHSLPLLLDLKPWALEHPGRARQLGLRYKPAPGRRITVGKGRGGSPDA